MAEEGTVFERHSEFYGKNKPLTHDYFFLTHMKLRKTGQTRLLDVGGGSGAFAILVKEAIPQSEVTVVDPTQNLLDMITDPHIKKIKGNLPYNLNIDDASFFDYICVKEVLHHLTNSSISGSKNLTIESLLELKTHLENEGYLLIQEIYYESPVIHTATRTMIFYLLAIQNFLKIKLPSKEFLLGLEVCFYTREELFAILKSCGFEIINTFDEPWYNSPKKYALFLKEWGRIFVIAGKKVDK